MTKTHVHIIKMGGTIEFIDPAYDEVNKKLLKLDTTLESYLDNLIQPHFSHSSEKIAEKDSRDINDDDRKRLIKSIKSTPHNNILLSHGTFTMQQTSQFIDQTTYCNKRIILT